MEVKFDDFSVMTFGISSIRVSSYFCTSLSFSIFIGLFNGLTVTLVVESIAPVFLPPIPLPDISVVAFVVFNGVGGVGNVVRPNLRTDGDAEPIVTGGGMRNRFIPPLPLPSDALLLFAVPSPLYMDGEMGCFNGR